MPSPKLSPKWEVTAIQTGVITHEMSDNFEWSKFLGGILETFGCQTGTIHRTAEDGVTLTLICQIGVPEVLMEKISIIPFGKGIAGAAAARKEPVELCNLQQDLGGVAKPDARQTGVAGSIALPIFASDSLQVIGTLGIGKYVPHEFTAAEMESLAGVAREIAGHFAH
jgi:L-methionine (R)-S-oxide reductase